MAPVLRNNRVKLSAAITSGENRVVCEITCSFSSFFVFLIDEGRSSMSSNAGKT